VGTYVGLTVQEATVQATSQGLEVRFNPSGPAADWVVVSQDPAPGQSVAAGSVLRLAVVAPATPTPAPPADTPAP
jgi:beta-lactam-binding protein with PASTA domain